MAETYLLGNSDEVEDKSKCLYGELWLMNAETWGQRSHQECEPFLRQLRDKRALHPGGQDLSFLATATVG